MNLGSMIFSNEWRIWRNHFSSITSLTLLSDFSHNSVYCDQIFTKYDYCLLCLLQIKLTVCVTAFYSRTKPFITTVLPGVNYSFVSFICLHQYWVLTCLMGFVCIDLCFCICIGIMLSLSWWKSAKLTSYNKMWIL